MEKCLKGSIYIKKDFLKNSGLYMKLAYESNGVSVMQ